MVSYHGQLNHSSSIGLQTTFGESPTCRSGALEPSSSGCNATTPRLGRTVGSKGNLEKQWLGPFFARALLSHVSAILLLHHPSVQQALLPQPTSTSRPASCKTSMTAIGFLVISCSHSLFLEVMDTLLAGAATNACTPPKSRQRTGCTSRQAGHRVAHHLGLGINSVHQTSLSSAGKHLPLLIAEEVRSEASKDATLVSQPSSSSLEGKCVQLARSLDKRGATTVRLDAKDASFFVDVAKLETKFEAYAAVASHLLAQNAWRRCVAPADKLRSSCLDVVAGGWSAAHNIVTSRQQCNAGDTTPLMVKYCLLGESEQWKTSPKAFESCCAAAPSSWNLAFS